MIIYNADGRVLTDVIVDDSSYRYIELMGKQQLVLKFASQAHIDIPIGSFVRYPEVGGQVYTLIAPNQIKINNRHSYEYELTMETAIAALRKFRVHNMVDGRVRFDLVATPREHLQQLVDNLNERDYGWTIGACVDGEAKLITYNHTRCDDALSQIAETFDTEFEVIGRQIYVHKVEYYKDAPLSLAYGKDHGFLSGVTRNNADDSLAVERLWVQGGERNIDATKYVSKYLVLPDPSVRVKYDGSSYVFNDEPGYAAFGGREYCSANNRLSVINPSKGFLTGCEDSLDLTDIYPKRTSVVGRVRYMYGGTSYTYAELIQAHPEFATADWSQGAAANINIDIYDDAEDVPEYVAALGSDLSIVFQTGNLAGREFNVTYDKTQHKFMLVRAVIDNVLMPDRTFRVRGADEVANPDSFIVYGCVMPESYIRAAEREMLKGAAKYLFEHEDPRFTFRGELDGIWAKKNWSSGHNIGAKIVVGGYVSFTDPEVQAEPVRMRILSIKEGLNDWHKPTIEISNETARQSVGGTLNKLEAESVHVDTLHRESLTYSKRTYAQAKESIDMLNKAFGELGKPITASTIQTMFMLVGSDGTQIEFVDALDSTNVVNWPGPEKNAETGAITFPRGIIHPMVGASKDITSEVTGTNIWFDCAEEDFSLTGDDKAYYVYARNNNDDERTGTYLLSENPLTGSQYYMLGLMNSPDTEGNRSFIRMYGFTEIAPGRITTDRIVTSQGDYLDLAAARMKLGDKFEYNVDGDGVLRIKGAINVSPSGDSSPVPVHRGNYESKTQYYVGDLVSYNGATYMCISNSKGVTPGTDSTKWMTYASKGEPGQQGQPGQPGTSGYTPYIQNGYWYINGVNTGIKAEGEDGDTPTIGDNGHWYIGGKDTGVVAAASDGIGISSVTEYYATGNSNTTAPDWTEFGTSFVAPTKEKRYLWNYELVSYTDGNSTKTTRAVIGTFAEDGRGISGVTEYYAISASSTEAPADSEFGTAFVVPTAEKPFVWNYEVITYTDGSTTTTNKAIIGARGGDGQPGPQGEPGKDAIIKTQYATSTYRDRTMDQLEWSDDYQPNTSLYIYIRQLRFNWDMEVFEYIPGTFSLSPVTLSEEVVASRNSIASRIGYDTWDAFMESVNKGQVIIENGYLNASLIDAEAIMAKVLSTKADGQRAIMEKTGFRLEDESGKIVSALTNKEYNSVADFAGVSSGSSSPSLAAGSISGQSESVSLAVGKKQLLPVEVARTSMGPSFTINSGSAGRLTGTLRVGIQHSVSNTCTLEGADTLVTLSLVSGGVYHLLGSVSLADSSFVDVPVNMMLPVGTYTLYGEFSTQAYVSNDTAIARTTRVTTTLSSTATTLSYVSANQLTEIFANGYGYRGDSTHYVAAVNGTDGLEFEARAGNNRVIVNNSALYGSIDGSTLFEIGPHIEWAGYFTCSGSSITLVKEFSQSGNSNTQRTRDSAGIYTLTFKNTIANMPIFITPQGSSRSTTQMAWVYDRQSMSFQACFRQSASGGSSTTTPAGFSVLILKI